MGTVSCSSGHFNQGEEALVPIRPLTGWVPEPMWNQQWKQNSHASTRKRILVVQSVASHNTELAAESLLLLSTQEKTSDLGGGGAGGK